MTTTRKTPYGTYTEYTMTVRNRTLSEAIVRQLEITWQVALESPSRKDWQFRWAAMMAKIDGMQDVVRLMDDCEDVRDAKADLCSLWDMAMAHLASDRSGI